MKKQNITKVLLACFIVAMSGFVLNLQAQDIVLEFTNPDGGDYGSGNEGFNGTGLGGYGDDAVEDAGDPYVEFAFTIGATGQIGLDVSTPTTYQPVVDVLNTWDNAAIGATTNAALFGKSFSLILTAESRIQLGSDSDGNRGGLGVRGENQRRIDDEGEDNEWMQFKLTGEVGIDFVRFGYNDVTGGDNAHALIKDHDTDKIWPILDGIDGDPHPPELYLDMAEYNMRYFSDILYLSKADTSDVGYRVYSLEFNVVDAEPKPPAVAETVPAHADTTVETTADYVIQFDVPVTQSSAEGAITFDPALPNQAFAWNETGDMVTISHDQLPYSTEYLVTITTSVKGAGDAGLNMLADTTFTFKTLPEPPTVLYTFPANLANKVPVTSPFELRFSKGMIDTTVEKSIEFTPPLGGMDFIWNADNSILYFSADEMMGSTQYFVTVGTDATDRFGVQLAAP
ncbi:MAG: Ig-like domain-containing protein, partial [Bacteroidales bacterium]